MIMKACLLVVGDPSITTHFNGLVVSICLSEEDHQNRILSYFLFPWDELELEESPKSEWSVAKPVP